MQILLFLHTDLIKMFKEIIHMEYYIAIENIIKKIEINSKARIYEENNEKLLGYWNIGNY